MVNAVYILKCSYPGEVRLTEILNLVRSRTQCSPGCIQSDLWRNDELVEIMLFEIWRSKEDFERHVHSPLYKHLLTVLEMSAENPQIRISEYEESGGIDIIREIIENGSE